MQASFLRQHSRQLGSCAPTQPSVTRHVAHIHSRWPHTPARVAQVDRPAEVDEPQGPAGVSAPSSNGSNGSTTTSLSTGPVPPTTTAAGVAPAATAVGLVGAAASEREDRPFVPVIDFQTLANTLLGDPEVLLKDKTLMGECCGGACGAGREGGRVGRHSFLKGHELQHSQLAVSACADQQQPVLQHKWLTAGHGSCALPACALVVGDGWQSAHGLCQVCVAASATAEAAEPCQ